MAYSKVIQRSHVGLPDEVPEKGFAVTCPLDRMPEQLIEKLTFQALRDYFRIAGDTSTTFAGYNFGLTNRREPYDPS